MTKYKPYGLDESIEHTPRKASPGEVDLLNQYLKNKQHIKDIQKKNGLILRALPQLQAVSARVLDYDKQQWEQRTFIVDKPKTFIVMNTELALTKNEKTTKADLAKLNPGA